jgi:hypothetical protein
MESIPARVIARAVAVAGIAYAHDVRGELRVLGVGDELADGETVVTPGGGRVELELIDGSLVLVHELSGRKIGREMIKGIELREKPLISGPALASIDAGTLQFANRLHGRAVRTASGNNLFYDEMPLYWSLDGRRSVAHAVVPAGSGGVVSDRIAFSVQLETGRGSSSLRVNEGLFSQEIHHIPFTTGDPQPGLPVAFFGIAEDSSMRGEQGNVGGERLLCAEINRVGNTNNWYREGQDFVFEFLGKAPRLGAIEPPLLAAADNSRAINSFSFTNTGATPVRIMARAYRGKDPAPVFEDGSPESPVEISVGGEYMAVSERNYDRLVLSQQTVAGSGNLSLSLAGYSEFLPLDGPMSVPILGTEAGRAKDGEMRFTIHPAASATPELHFRRGKDCSTPSVFDSIWDRL